MIAFDLATRYRKRLLSAVICDARADSPESFARPWDARIDLAREQGMKSLASPTVARGFGARFRETEEVRAIHRVICEQPVEGFIGTRTEARRVGKGCVSKGRTGWRPY